MAEVVDPEPSAPVPALGEPLFGGDLPLTLGAHPEGLANVTAQGCHACHPAAYQAWKGGPHARGPSEALEAAVARTGITACRSCHLPLQTQHDRTPTWEADAEAAPQPDWSATLRLEGVTCAACHVRDGRVAVASARAAQGVGPHVVAHAPGLAESGTCAACHQLTWPGADVPMYDTYGEWSRSAWAEAGVTCVDCHHGPAGTHDWGLDPGRAVSLLVSASARTLVRGDDPLQVELVVQNTGAGHAYPSGTPFRGLRLIAEVQRPDGTAIDGAFTVDLARQLDTEPPWTTREDTRLQAGETRSWPWSVTFGLDQPPGPWVLDVRLVPTLQGEPAGDPILVQRLPLVVE